jgi:hypothetical protein
MIVFNEHAGTYSGIGGDGRMWRITRAFAGWRLDFRDPGDSTSTSAGLHGSLAAAQAEANRETRMTPRRIPAQPTRQEAGVLDARPRQS